MIQYPARVGGVLTRVIEAGHGARNVILLHGMGARADRWKANLGALAKAGFHSYALDLPGHGLAEKGAHLQFTVPAFADFIDAFMDAFRIRAALLVGTSLGGNVMGYVASRSVHRVQGLVLIGSLGLEPLSQETRTRLSRTLVDCSLDGTRRKLERLLHNQALLDDEWVREEYMINNSDGAAESFERLADYVLSEDGINEHGCMRGLERLASSKPLLLVHGADDKSIPLRIGAEAHLQIPRSEFLELPESGHAPYLEQADAFNTALVAFFGRCPLHD